MTADAHPRANPRPWRLVLSGGGTGGAYWMAGTLEALAGAGLNLASADLIVGTSAGALMGSVIALGGRPWDLVGNVSSPAGSLADASVRRAAQQRPTDFLRHRLMPSMGVRLSAAIGSLLPVGGHSIDHVESLVRDIIRPGVVPHQGLRICTVERLSARRVVFGPELEWLPKAVAASCAVPGWFVPVEIDGAYYVDGGVHSNFSLDIAADVYRARVIVLSPLTGVAPRSRDPGWLAMAVARSELRRLLRREIRLGMRIKAKVLVLEPDKEEVLAMGLNLMDDAHGTEIHQMALERTRVRLSDPSWQKMLGEIGA
jgi:NTE family protein